MEESELKAALKAHFPDMAITELDGNDYYFALAGQMMPFMTLMSNDLNDSDSHLDRPGVYRLNLGLSKKEFVARFGSEPKAYDFKALDILMPHPVYGNVLWACVLNPSAQTLETLWPLLEESRRRALKVR